MIIYYFQQLKLFSLIVIGFSLFFMSFVTGHEPKLEAIGIFTLILIVSSQVGILQIFTSEPKTNSDLYLLHLPIEKSEIWLMRSFCGVITIVIYYTIINLLCLFNPTTPLIDLTIILLGSSSYFLSRSISVFAPDNIQAIFLSILAITIIYLALPSISFISNPLGLAFPVQIQLPYILVYTILSILLSYYFETKYFRKSIN